MSEAPEKKFDPKIYDVYKDKIKKQAYEIQFCLENDYNDTNKTITPWMKKMWKNSNKDWFKRTEM